jgi:hypothetical protein
VSKRRGPRYQIPETKNLMAGLGAHSVIRYNHLVTAYRPFVNIACVFVNLCPISKLNRSKSVTKINERFH